MLLISPDDLSNVGTATETGKIKNQIAHYKKMICVHLKGDYKMHNDRNENTH